MLRICHFVEWSAKLNEIPYKIAHILFLCGVSENKIMLYFLVVEQINIENNTNKINILQMIECFKLFEETEEKELKCTQIEFLPLSLSTIWMFRFFYYSLPPLKETHYIKYILEHWINQVIIVIYICVGVCVCKTY